MQNNHRTGVPAIAGHSLAVVGNWAATNPGASNSAPAPPPLSGAPRGKHSVKLVTRVVSDYALAANPKPIERATAVTPKTETRDSIDRQVRGLLKKKAAVMVQEHMALRTEYIRLGAELRAALVPLELSLKSFLQMSQEELAEYYAGILQGGSRPAINFTELLGKGGKIPPIYKDPRDPQNTWTGRGNKPRWVVDYLTKHPRASLDALLIDKRLVGKGTSKRALPAVYAHPTIAALTWTGRGHMPTWIKSYLQENPGAKLASLRIPGAKLAPPTEASKRAKKATSARRSVAKKVAKKSPGARKASR